MTLGFCKSKLAITLIVLAVLVSCGPTHSTGGLTPVKRPNWSDAEARQAVESLVGQYRVDGEAFWTGRKYVWAGTWVWPETVGITAKHLELLKKMFYEGDDATREIVLNVIFMNIPAKELEKSGKSFLTDLVVLDTDLKERRANIPPPTFNHEIIEEYVPVE